MSDDKNKGWEYLNSDDNESYYGDDGSWGYKNEDGSASFNGADGSWGYRNADGSGSYYDADGSWGTINSDGSYSFYGADGSSDFKDADAEDDDDVNPSADSSDGGSLLGVAVGLGLIGIAAAIIGKRNSTSDSSDNDDDDDANDDDENDQSEESRDDIDDSAYQRQEELRRYAEEQQRQEKARIKREKKKAFRRKHWKGILVTVLVLGAALFGGYKYWEYSKLIPVGISAESLQNTAYESVVEILEDAGFTNVHTSSLYDLDYASKDDDGLVATVLISDNKSFEADDKYPYDSRIDVQYHSVTRASVPFSAKEAKGEQYSEIVNKLKNAGFGDIVISVDYDLITGWLNGFGEVETISINENSSFDSGSKFTVDSKIEIVYHDFKRNNPEK